MPAQTADDWLTTSEAGQLVGESADTVRRAVADGTLPAVRLRRRGWLKIRREDLDRIAASSEAVDAAVPGRAAVT